MADHEDAPAAKGAQPHRKPRAKKLTEISVERLRPPASGRLQLADAVVAGLWLRVTANGVKSWSVVYRAKGSPTLKRYTIGRWPAISVRDARNLAREVLLEVARGKDPAADRKRAARGEDDRFENVADEFIQRRVRPRQPRSWQQTAGLIESRLVKPWRGRRIGDITKADVHRVLDREVDAGHGRTANLLLQVAKALFAWAEERHEIDRNPATGISRPAVERSRDHVLTDEELSAIWTAAGELGWPWGDYARVLILTAQRRSEVSSMRWSDVDLEAGVWSMPAERTKSKRAHTVPLSEPVVAILREAPRLTDPDNVFWTGRGAGLSGFTQSKGKIDRLSGVMEWRYHDLRRSAATGMARLGVAPHVLAAVLNHSPTSVQNVTAIYNRFRYEGEKAQALAAWGEHVLALAEGRAGKVVPLRPA
jgi:integrase